MQFYMKIFHALRLVHQLFIFVWRAAGECLKNAVKVVGGRKAARRRNFRHGQIGLLHQHNGAGNPHPGKIHNGRKPRNLFKQPGKMKLA